MRPRQIQKQQSQLDEIIHRFEEINQQLVA
jgi:hypothetical protein